MFRDVPGCFGMFRNVPECSGMFHVPGFIDALNRSCQKTRFKNITNAHINRFGPPLRVLVSAFVLETSPQRRGLIFFVHALQRCKTDVIGVCFIFPEFEWGILGSRCTRMLRSVAIKVVSITFHFHCRYTFWLCGTGFICRIFTSY